MNVCQLGHKKHDRKLIRTKLGRMWVYDVEKYNNNPGFYCTGQDILSTTIINQGSWEDRDTVVIEGILKKGDRDKIVLDFGCHIGWYTIMAAKLGYKVLAYDGDKENLDLLMLNARLHGVLNKVVASHVWLDDETPSIEQLYTGVELLKADIEGNESHVIRMVSPLLDKKAIKNMYLEISPAFNKGYPNLVKSLTDRGFKAFYPEGEAFDDDFSLGQINLRFSI